MAFNEKNKNEITMNFNDIISNIDSLKTKDEFITIQTSMNEIFMNSSFIKESSSKKEIITKLDNIIFFINSTKNKNKNKNENNISTHKNNIHLLYISLGFLTLLETKIKNIPSYILESLLIDNNKIVNLFRNIFIYI